MPGEERRRLSPDTLVPVAARVVPWLVNDWAAWQPPARDAAEDWDWAAAVTAAKQGPPQLFSPEWLCRLFKAAHPAWAPAAPASGPVPDGYYRTHGSDVNVAAYRVLLGLIRDGSFTVGSTRPWAVAGEWSPFSGQQQRAQERRLCPADGCDCAGCGDHFGDCCTDAACSCDCHPRNERRTVPRPVS